MVIDHLILEVQSHAAAQVNNEIRLCIEQELKSRSIEQTFAYSDFKSCFSDIVSYFQRNNTTLYKLNLSRTYSTQLTEQECKKLVDGRFARYMEQVQSETSKFYALYKQSARYEPQRSAGIDQCMQNNDIHGICLILADIIN